MPKMRKISHVIFLTFLISSIGCGSAQQHPVLFSTSPAGWTQADWSGGIGPSTENQYKAATGMDTSAPNQLTLALRSHWFDQNWAYRRAITIDNTLNTNQLTEYQILVQGIDTAALIAAGKMNADCSDIRFAGATGVPLDYVIIGDTCDTSNTRLWVKVDTIAASSSTTVYLYYGNLHAAPFESEVNTFSYTAARLVGIVGNANLAGGSLNVISLEDGNTISDGTSQLNLNEQEVGSFPAAELSVGTEITATDLFYADGSDDGRDMLTPISFAGQLFIHYANRYDHFYTIYSQWAEADITVYLDGVPQITPTIPAGTSTVYNPGVLNDRTIRIESDVPVYVHHHAVNGGNINDGVVLYPATSDDLYGVPSSNLDIAAGSAGANVSWIRYDGGAPGSPQSLGANGRYEESGLGVQGTAGGFRVTTDAPIGASQVADGDGGESTAFWPLKELGSRFGANGTVQYITVAAPIPSTTCTVFDSGGGIPANPEPGFTNPYTGGIRDDVNFLYFGDSNPAVHSWLGAGWMMNCDAPVYAYYELDNGAAAEPNDEHNLWSYPQMRQFTYPTPSAGTPGSEVTRYEGSGTLTSNAFDAGSGGGLWKTVTFVTDDESNTVVKARSSNDPSMTGAPAFSSCDPLTNGQTLADNNCVNDGDRYIQYYINLTSSGLVTPTFQSITIGYTSIEPPVANAGPDRIVVGGRQITLDGSGSTGIDLTYNWAIIQGSGSLEDETTATPIYISNDVMMNEDVVILLTVRDVYGLRSTNEVTIHLLVTAQGADVRGGELSNIIAANANGTIIYQSTTLGADGMERRTLVTDKASIQLPLDSEFYTLALTDDNRLIIGLPDMDGETGRVYLTGKPINEMEGTTNLEEVPTVQEVPEAAFDESKDDDVDTSGGTISIGGNNPGDRFGHYLAAGDLDGDGSQEIVVGAVGAGTHGWTYILDQVFQLKGVLIGNEEFPLYSIFVSNILDTAGDDMMFGPYNDALSINLRLGDISEIMPVGYAFVLAGTDDFSGVTILEAGVVDARIGIGATHQAVDVGDVNGDGQDDVAMTSVDGNAYIFYGPIARGSDLSIGDADQVIAGGSPADAFGRAIIIGDANGDGIPDVEIGSPDSGASMEGAVDLVFGNPDVDNPIELSTSANVMIVAGENSDGHIGGDLLLADRNGDGINEIYTVKEFKIVYEINLATPRPSSGGSGCNLTKSSIGIQSRTTLIILFCAITITFVLSFLRTRRSQQLR